MKMGKWIQKIFQTVMLIFMISGISLGVVIFLQTMIEANFNIFPLLFLFSLILAGSILLVRWQSFRKERKRFSMLYFRRTNPLILTDAFSKRKKAEKQLCKALNHIENIEYDRAADLLMRMEAICTDEKERFAVFYLQALCFHFSSQFQMALSLYSRALEERAVYPAASGKARCLDRLGDLEGALEAYRYAAWLDREEALPCMRMAYIYFNMKEYEAALECIDEVLVREDDGCFAYILAAKCYAMLENREAMEDAFQNACACGADPEILEEELKSMVGPLDLK